MLLAWHEETGTQVPLPRASLPSEALAPVVDVDWSGQDSALAACSLARTSPVVLMYSDPSLPRAGPDLAVLQASGPRSEALSQTADRLASLRLPSSPAGRSSLASRSPVPGPDAAAAAAVARPASVLAVPDPGPGSDADGTEGRAAVTSAAQAEGGPPAGANGGSVQSRRARRAAKP